MLPPHAMVMEAALMMEIAYVTMDSIRLIAQVKFFGIIQSSKCFFEILNTLFWIFFVKTVS